MVIHILNTATLAKQKSQLRAQKSVKRGFGARLNTHTHKVHILYSQECPSAPGDASFRQNPTGLIMGLWRAEKIIKQKVPAERKTKWRPKISQARANWGHLLRDKWPNNLWGHNCMTAKYILDLVRTMVYHQQYLHDWYERATDEGRKLYHPS